MSKALESEEIGRAIITLCRAHGYEVSYDLVRVKGPREPPPWEGRAWRELVRAALDASGRGYVVTVIDGETRAMTVATLEAEHVPPVLRGIAESIERKALTVVAPEDIHGGN